MFRALRDPADTLRRSLDRAVEFSTLGEFRVAQGHERRGLQRLVAADPSVDDVPTAMVEPGHGARRRPGSRAHTLLPLPVRPEGRPRADLPTLVAPATAAGRRRLAGVGPSSSEPSSTRPLPQGRRARAGSTTPPQHTCLFPR